MEELTKQNNSELQNLMVAENGVTYVSHGEKKLWYTTLLQSIKQTQSLAQGSAMLMNRENYASISSASSLWRPLKVKGHIRNKEKTQARCAFREIKQEMQTEVCRNKKAKHKNTDMSWIELGKYKRTKVLIIMKVSTKI